MGNMSFTPAQQDAIDAAGGSLIVSAAAGSGKTRVLVQRVIRMMTDKKNPVSADRMLIVTFTKAAAAEMKNRISSEIENLIKEYPEDMNLKHQQILLANADICTIDSFCSRIVRDNFYALDINQDFRISTGDEVSVMKHQIMADMIEEQYSQHNEDFLMLSAVLSGTKSDKQIENALLEVYEKSMSHPSAEKWLEESAEFYNPNQPLSQSVFVMIAYDNLKSSIRYLNLMLESAEEVIYGNQGFCTGTKTCAENKLNYLQAFVKRLSQSTESRVWNNISECIKSFEKVKYIRPKGAKNSVTDEEHQSVKNSFDNIDAEIENLMLIFGTDEETYENDTRQLYPAVVCMCRMIKEFKERLLNMKKEKGILDFSDLEHLTLKLLMKDTDSPKEKSKFAETLSQRYDEIMVDEFQDTNEVQESIFHLISRNETNLFVVGDIKQSIYRFREAMPEIFQQRRQKAKLFKRDEPEFPAMVILDKNFRSREGIIDSVNFVFQCIMSRKVGEIDYNENERLTVGATYPETEGAETEIHILDIYDGTENSDDDDASRYEKEGLYIAKKIREMVDGKTMITENGQLRPVRYDDFCILMRFVKKHCQEYAEVMNRFGIPTYVEQPYSLFGCYEVNIVLSLLKVVDNCLQDIPMLAVMICSVFGFTADDLADLKSKYKSRHIYNRISACIRSDTADTDLKRKCEKFLDLIGRLRLLSVTLSVTELIETFFEETGYLSMISAMTNGEIRVKNIRKLISFISDYEKSGKTSLSDFVRHILYLEENGTEISVGDTVPANSVKIMSIHRSKGLEFPICIMAGLNLTGSDIPPAISCHPKLGFGFKMVERDTMFKFNTIQRNIIEQTKKQEELSEEMRILYVAMTRAKEKLIAVISFCSGNSDGFTKKLQKAASLVKVNNNQIEPYCVEKADNLGEWLLMCAFAHPNMSELRKEAGIEGSISTIPTKSRWKYVHAFCETETEKKAVEEEERAESDKEFLKFLRHRFSERYSYGMQTEIPAKVSASALTHNDTDSFRIAGTRPSFMQEESLTGTEKGTAMHTFLQYADFQELEKDIKAEKDRLVQNGRMTKEQIDCLNEEDIKAFLESDTYRHIKNAVKVYREYKFTVNISANEVDETFDEKESVILQGAMDCVVIEDDGIIIIDYKTDRVKNVSELERRYKKQLALYKSAAQQLFDIPVKKCIIYSLHCRTEKEL